MTSAEILRETLRAAAMASPDELVRGWIISLLDRGEHAAGSVPAKVAGGAMPAEQARDPD